MLNVLNLNVFLALSFVTLQVQAASSSSSWTNSAKFEVRRSLGNLSPFFTPEPVPPSLVGGLGTGMPEECELVQVQLVRLFVFRISLISGSLHR